MRIGVNALYLIPGGVGGTEIYLRSLLEAMGRVDRVHEWIVFTNRETGVMPPFRCVVQPVAAVNRAARILYEQFALPVAVARERVDVLLNPGFTAPTLAPCRQVTVFHDLQHKRHPEHFRWYDLPAWRVMLWLSACASDRLIAVSEATRADLLRYYPVAPSSVVVAPHGVDERMFELAARRDPQPYVLCVSTLHPHKNIERLVRVFAKFRARHPEWRLVLAGMRGFHTEAVERQVAAAGLGDAVSIPGWIERSSLYELYRRAGVFVFPSTFEGFGMPVLEALAAGVPVACSDIEPLRGLGGDSVVRFCPEDELGMLAALEGVIRNPARGGVEQARRFSWEASARVTLEALEAAMRG